MNKENDIKIDISGGDWMEREMLTDLVSGQLHDRGFKNVEAINAHGAKVRCNQINYHSPRTILDTVSEARPDLFDRKITVVPAPRESIFYDSPHRRSVNIDGTRQAVSHFNPFDNNDDGQRLSGVAAMIRTDDSHGAIVDTRYYDCPAKLVDTVRTIGGEPQHIGIRANNALAGCRAVAQALLAAPDAYVTVSLRGDPHETIMNSSTAIYFNDPPEKIIDISGKRPGSRQLPNDDDDVDLTTDDYGNPLNNDPVHQQVVQMVKDKYAPEADKVEPLGEKKYIPPVDSSKKKK